MTDNFVNFHTHTIGSILDGQGKPDEYMKAAANLGMDALAITDHGNLFKWIDFYEAGKEYGVKPILGMEGYCARKRRFDRDPEEVAQGATDEFDQTGPYHMTLIAGNDAGYRNLIKLSSRAYLEGFLYKPRMDYELLDEHSEGLVLLSGCLNGPVSQALMREDFNDAMYHAGMMQDIVGKDNFFIEVMDHTIPEERRVTPQLEKIANKIGAKIIPTCDSHYVYKEDSTAHDITLCVSTGAKVFEEKRFKFLEEEFFLRSYNEMLERFPAEWLKNSQVLAEEIADIDIEFDVEHFPQFSIPTDETPFEHFERLVWEGVHSRYGDSLSQEVIERTQFELMTIGRLGFSEYFLIVGDLVSWAHEQKIRVGLGRGSASGSIASYALGITNLDPIKMKLPFERFLLPQEVEYEPQFEKAQQ